ncbi:MAG: hypothetical protein E7446_07840 [Ruminococcaceae bacterium]|nr:hypothetical protein [Oscillospiraceae bacterium]
MRTELPEKEVIEIEPKNKKQKRGTGFILLLAAIVILLLISTAVLGSRLYELATRDRYTVDLGLGEPEGSIEMFRIEYSNEAGEITVRGLSADNVVAPGTAVNYDIRLRNNDEVVIDFLMTPTVEFLTGDEVPVEFRVMDDYGNYILGGENEWVNAEQMNTMAHKGSIHPGEVFTYHVSWRWVFEVSDRQNDYDTYLGIQDGEIVPGVAVGIATEATANPQLTTKDITHLAHLRGESFGCCWCCWLVWTLLLTAAVLVAWVWRLKKKVYGLEEMLGEYEEIMRLSSVNEKR